LRAEETLPDRQRFGISDRTRCTCASKSSLEEAPEDTERFRATAQINDRPRIEKFH
jgi:hypothetical protein